MVNENLLRAFDIVLAISLVGLATMLLLAKDLFKSVVMFIVFGLLMSITWVRLSAPDIALAEAAIGAGLTGALLLRALRQLQPALISASEADTRLNEE